MLTDCLLFVLVLASRLRVTLTTDDSDDVGEAAVLLQLQLQSHYVHLGGSAGQTFAEVLRNNFSVYYINLPKRTDRRKSLEDQLTRVGLPSAKRFEALQGTMVPAAVIGRRWQSGLNAKFEPKQRPTGWHDLSDGERGCAGSHVALWERCVSENRPMVIIEDDADFHQDFPTRFQEVVEHITQHDPSLVYLQSIPAKFGPYRKTLRHGVDIRELKYGWLTGAYIVWPKTAATLLAHLPMDRPVDNYMASLAYNGQIRAYASVPPIVNQFYMYTDSDVGHSAYALMKPKQG